MFKTQRWWAVRPAVTRYSNGLPCTELKPRYLWGDWCNANGDVFTVKVLCVSVWVSINFPESVWPFIGSYPKSLICWYFFLERWQHRNAELRETLGRQGELLPPGTGLEHTNDGSSVLHSSGGTSRCCGCYATPCQSQGSLVGWMCPVWVVSMFNWSHGELCSRGPLHAFSTHVLEGEIYRKAATNRAATNTDQSRALLLSLASVSCVYAFSDLKNRNRLIWWIVTWHDLKGQCQHAHVIFLFLFFSVYSSLGQPQNVIRGLENRNVTAIDQTAAT